MFAVTAAEFTVEDTVNILVNQYIPLWGSLRIILCLAKYLGVLVLVFPHLNPTATSWPGRSVLELAFPHLKPTATSWPGRTVLELAFPHLKPTATTWSERREGEHVA